MSNKGMKYEQVKWDDSFYLKAYEMARSGMKLTAVAGAFKVTPERFRKWMAEKPALKEAINKGRTQSESQNSVAMAVARTEQFKDYVYGRLPEELHDAWDRIFDREDMRNTEKRIETLLKGKGDGMRQQLFVYALIQFNFDTTKALSTVGVSRKVFDRWVESDPDFVGILDNVMVAKKDFCESALMDLVKARDTSAVIFANKTLNADRGFGTVTKHEHTGIVGHGVADVRTLPSELQEQLLNHFRLQRGEEALPPRIIEAKIVPKLTQGDNAHEEE